MKHVITYKRGKKLKVLFQGNLVTRNLAEVHASLVKALEKTYESVTVVLKDYEKFDFAFIQLLLVFKTHVEEKGLKLVLESNFKEADQSLLDRLKILELLETKIESNESASS